MNYDEALNFINGAAKLGSKLGLYRIKKLLNLLGDPQNKVKCIHIAGTNGKGSVSAYTATMLQEAGYKVGLFTSPYIETFNERIQINRININNKDLVRITEIIKDKIDLMLEKGYGHPTVFEIITAIAFKYFEEQHVDYVVLEVGLGGRLDSTNVIENSLISIITTISTDHVNILGDTLDKIAYEKAGIIKQNGLVVSYPQKKEALEILKKVAKEKQAKFFVCPTENVKINYMDDCGSIFSYKYKDKIYNDLKIKLLGKYQIYNASLALTAILNMKERGLVNITNGNIREGLSKTEWIARLEVLKRNPIFLIDGSHNIQGIESLISSLKLFKYKRLILGISILRDKDVEHMISKLVPLADKVIITEANIYRRMDAEELSKIVNKYNNNYIIEKDIQKAICEAMDVAHEDDLIVFAGSLYLVGDVRKIIMNR